MKKIFLSLIFLTLAVLACGTPVPNTATSTAAIASATSQAEITTTEWSSMGERNGHPVLLVNGRPFFILGATDPVGFSLGGADPSPRFPHDYERYFAEANRLGFNTVSPELLWSTFESLDNSGQSAWDYTRLEQIKTLAEANSLKVIVEWVGIDWSGATNSAPRYIVEDTSGIYQQIRRSDGSLAQNPKSSYGVYSWTNQAIVNRESAALSKLAEWIRENDPEHIIIMVSINIEFGINPSLGTDRSYDAESDRLYAEGGYTDPERFNQDTAQAYFQTVTGAFHKVIPGFPLTTATWAPNHGNPYNYLNEWLEHVPDLSFIGPDIYGARLDSIDRFLVGRNAIFVLNQGVNSYGGYTYCDWPWRIAFPLAGEPYDALGINVFRLVGDTPWNKSTPLFWGLVYSGMDVHSPWFPEIKSAWDWFPWAYAVRNSFVGLRAVDELLPDAQGTPRLATFMSGYGPLEQSDRTIFTLENMTIEVTAHTAAVCDSDWSTFQAGSRGLLLQTGPRDLTLVGVDYTATLQVDTRSWQLRIERGGWDGETWKMTGEALSDTVRVDSNTGYITLSLSPEDLENQDTPGLQYVLRVYDLGSK